jgi:hypothetical protein
MTNPITPPPELVQQLCDRAFLHGADGVSRGEIEVWLIQEAFRAGADRELEACCVLLELSDKNARDFLYSARRPKPPSLKEQALGAMGRFTTSAHTHADEMMRDFDTIRRALEQLDD